MLWLCLKFIDLTSRYLLSFAATNAEQLLFKFKKNCPVFKGSINEYTVSLLS